MTIQVKTALDLAPNLSKVDSTNGSGKWDRDTGKRYAEPVRSDATEPSILIVDNEEINRWLLRATLKSAPYRILECRRASEAMELLESTKIDLVVLDLMLPEVSGPELCRWLKNNCKTQLIPVLMLTSVQGIE